MPNDVETIADLLIEAHRQGRQIAEPPPGIAPPTRDEAFAIQDRVRSILGGAGGWKAGAPDSVTQPIAAPLLASLIFADRPVAGVTASLAIPRDRRRGGTRLPLCAGTTTPRRTLFRE
jgi:2-keto-4-pentenoate hydratase